MMQRPRSSAWCTSVIAHRRFIRRHSDFSVVGCRGIAVVLRLFRGDPRQWLRAGLDLTFCFCDAGSRMDKILARALGEDVSKLATQERQLLLSRLLARVAHEIRNPLSSLDIHVQLLEEDLAQAPLEVKEKAANRFEIIHGELHRLENVVKHFLSLAGPSSLSLETVEIRKIISHVCELLRPEAETRGIKIVMSVPETLPQLTADPVQLTQALVNLVINAIQAVENNGLVEVGAHVDTANEMVAVEIRDSGPGVPKEKQAAIFEPFFTTKAEGSGLGLWVVQQVVSAHDGGVFVGDAVGGGAVFTVQLPLRKKKAVHG